MSYKPDVDDARETPALQIATLLAERYELRCHDPFVRAWELPLFRLEEVDGWADVLVVLADHKVYGSKQFRSPLLSYRDLINAERSAVESKPDRNASDLRFAHVTARSPDRLLEEAQAPRLALRDADRPVKVESHT